MSRYIDEPTTPTAVATRASQPASAAPRSSQGRVLRGQYQAPLRSDKGKVKGIILETATGSINLKLPKYLRPMLVRELSPGSWVQVWAFPEDDRWRAINLIPWPVEEVPADLKVALAAAPASPPASGASAPKIAPVCIQVCRKGKCFKQGGATLFQALQAEIDHNPSLNHVTLEATGCMKACKQGPNLRVLPQKKMHSRVTPDRALAILADYQRGAAPSTSPASDCRG